MIHQKLKQAGGEGGVIALDAKGNIAMTFNSNGMFRGFIKAGGKPEVFIFRDE